MQNHVLFVDVSNPASPRLLSDYQIIPRGTPQPSYGGWISGDYCYVAVSASGLAVLNVSNPGQPSLAATRDVGFGTTQNVQVVGDRAYVSISFGSSRGLTIFDVSDPTSPNRRGSYPRAGAWGIEVVGDYCHIAGHYQANVGYGGYTIVNASDIDNLFAVGGAFDPPWFCVDVEVVGNYAYLTEEAGQNFDGTYGIRVCDISNIDTTEVVGFTEMVTPPLYMTSWFENLIVAGRSGGLYVYDLSDPTSPRLTGRYNEQMNAIGDVVTDGHYAYCANYDDLLILDISSALTIPRNAESSPIGFYLGSAYPNPFNGAIRIPFSIPAGSPAKLSIFDLQGREAARILDGYLPAGSYSPVWNGEPFRSGSYFIRLTTTTGSATQRVEFVR